MSIARLMGFVPSASAVMLSVSMFFFGILEHTCFLAVSSAKRHSSSICSLVNSDKPCVGILGFLPEQLLLLRGRLDRIQVLLELGLDVFDLGAHAFFLFCQNSDAGGEQVFAFGEVGEDFLSFRLNHEGACCLVDDGVVGEFFEFA